MYYAKRLFAITSTCVLQVPGHTDATVNLNAASRDIEAENNYITKCFI